LFDAYAARLEENARLTLQFYDVPNLPSTERLRVALIALGHTPPALSATDRVTLFERLKTYFLSDESDLVIASPVVAASMASAVARLETLDDAAIREALRATVPAKLQEEDPKGIDYTLESIKARLKEISGETRVNAALAAVGKEAGVDLTDPAHRALAVDLRDDLAAVNYGFVMLPAASFKALAGRELKDKERVTLETDLTGWPPLSVKFDRELMASMIQSIVLSAAVVFLLLALQLRSLVGGLMASAPIFINQLTTFGVMSLAGIPLDNSTMMITSIAMGIGVGYTIQLIARLKLEMRGGLALPEAVHKALGTTGRAILINSAAVAAGFLVLVFSEMTPQKRFGSLIALTMFFSSFGALTLLPAIFLKRVPAFLRRAAGDR
jgi:predicted RND superfamily exporter protein